jgi:PAS domain-containing protein
VLRLLPVLLAIAPPALAADPGAATPALLASLTAVSVPLACWFAWRFWQLGRRTQDLMGRNAKLGAANATLHGTIGLAEARARMLDGVLAAMSDGVAVVDAELRLAGWNPRFAAVAGVPIRALRIGQPFEEIVRMQAEAGEFGLVDPEAETARRMKLLREGRMLGRWQRERPDGSRIELRRAPLPGGGFVTLYSPLVTTEPALPPGIEEAVRAEWAARVPRLVAAAADGDTEAVRAAAHALRGVAANAGWTGAVTALAAVEAAAQAGDLKEVRGLASMLLVDQPW